MATLNLIILSLILTIVALIGFKFYWSKRGFKYSLNQSILSERKLHFYWQLVRAFPNHIVCPHVHLSKVISLKGEFRKKGRAFIRIAQLSCDFVLCARSGKPLAVIEVREPAEQYKNPSFNEKIMTEVLTSSGLPIHRLDSEKIPSVDDFQALLNFPNDYSRIRAGH